jgi:excisionase family DNA binding protein
MSPEQPIEAQHGKGIVASNSPALTAEHLLSVEEVAELLQVPVSWVYDRTRRRSVERIPGFRLGKYWRFRSEDVLAWIERQRVGGRPNA